MDDFDALVVSIGEHAVSYIGKAHLSGLFVFGDEVDMTAFVEIYLSSSSWAEQDRAIEKMIELRAMFMDDAAIDYRFVEPDESSTESARARRMTYAMA